MGERARAPTTSRTLGVTSLHARWFLDNFADPAAWVMARQTYVRTTAVWSMVGCVLSALAGGVCDSQNRRFVAVSLSTVTVVAMPR
jgi:hypothetical protein